MKRISTILLLLAASVLCTFAATEGGKITTRNISVQEKGRKLTALLDIVLDSLHLASNHQLFVTPYVQSVDKEECAMFPTVLINGRNMQYVYQRSGLSKDIAERYTNINQVVRRKNGTEQAVEYAASLDIAQWMHEKEMMLLLAIDTCGCGSMKGCGDADSIAFSLMPDAPETDAVATLSLRKFYTAYITPPVTKQPIIKHEGKARVQFEVDRTVLHVEPYVCQSGQRIDNRAQLQVIKDSIDYALSDPNVEIESINICGYASPESPYLHNQDLATNRSRALAEYIGALYNLPQEQCTYDAVPENWGEFRQQVVAATDITEQQRQDLLALIDKPTYGPSDFDAKEATLKGDARFARLYRTKILPVWFPELRCTKFAIGTRLKPMEDEKLAEIIRKTPDLLSLNQMFRVARLYEEGSQEFNEVIEIALRKYSDDPIANLNAAVTAIKAGDYDRAAQLLPKAGNSPEAENARGVLAAYQGDLEAASQYFDKAGNLPEARLNRGILQE